MKTQKKNKTKQKKNKTKKTVVKPILKNINNYPVLFIKNKSKTISIQSFIFKGFIHENKSNLGINHLLEHVLSNAYKNCENYNCYEYLNLLGLLSNASTDYNIIKYYATGLLKETNKIIDYIINITVNPTFNEQLITKEKEAVHNELLISLDDPDQRLYNEMDKNFYTIEGLKNMDNDQLMIDNLKHFNYNNLMKYYRKNYNNTNTLFVVSGDYNTESVINIFRKNLPDIPFISSPKNYKTIKCFTNNYGFYHVKNLAINSTKILFFFPTTFYINSNKLLQLDIAGSILQDILFDKLRVEKELVYGVKLNTVVNTCGTIQKIFINTKNKHLVNVLTECKKILNKYKKEKFSKKFMDAAKKKYLVEYNDKKYNAEQYANMYGQQFIYKHFLDTKVLSPEELKNYIMKINSTNILSIINEVFNFSKCMIVYSNNQKKIVYKF